MTTKTTTRKTTTDETLVAQVVAETPQSPLALDELIAQKRALDAQIRAAKDAMPKLSKLDRIIARQAAVPTIWVPRTLHTRVRERYNAGQPYAEAVAEVLEVYRAILLEAAPETKEQTKGRRGTQQRI